MKIDFRGMAVLTFMLIGAGTLMAQDKTAASNSKPAKPAAQASMSTPTPAPEMTKLIKMMSGNWTVTEKSNPNPMMPKGGTGKGMATMTAGPGGLSLMEKYRSSGLVGRQSASLQRSVVRHRDARWLRCQRHNQVGWR
jgi:hypothetical protein